MKNLIMLLFLSVIGMFVFINCGNRSKCGTYLIDDERYYRIDSVSILDPYTFRQSLWLVKRNVKFEEGVKVVCKDTLCGDSLVRDFVMVNKDLVLYEEWSMIKVIQEGM